MAALRISKSLRTKCCLISGLRGPASYDVISRELARRSLFLSLQAAQRTYSSPAKGTSEVHEDPRNKPIPFSTSKARLLTLNETLGDMKKKTSYKSVYVSLIAMAIITYIIFFLPGPKEEEEWDLLEDAEIATGQDKGQ